MSVPDAMLIAVVAVGVGALVRELFEGAPAAFWYIFGYTLAGACLGIAWPGIAS